MPGSEEANEEEEVEPPPEREPRESLQIPQVHQRSNQEIDHVSPSATLLPIRIFNISLLSAPVLPAQPDGGAGHPIRAEGNGERPAEEGAGGAEAGAAAHQERGGSFFRIHQYSVFQPLFRGTLVYREITSGVP